MTDTDQNNMFFDEPVPEDTVPEDTIIYRWRYAEQTAPVKKPPRRKLSLYAGVMTAVFLVSFAMLIAVLWVGRYDPDRALTPGVSGTHDDVAIDGVEQARQVVTLIEVKSAYSTGSGSGIILRRDGYIATNHHVIEDAISIKVTFYDGTTAMAQVVGSSEADDLAVIKVDRGDLPEARFAAYADCYVGQTVYAIGAPGGPEYGWTTTRGIISYKDREVKMYDDDNVLLKKLRLVQTDANVNPGNSGGPLINTAGEVIGVVSMKLAEGYEGIGFAIPADGACEILQAIIDGKDFNSSVSHQRPMLGILCSAVEAGNYYLMIDNDISIVSEEVARRSEGKYEVFHPEVTGVLVTGISEGMGAVDKLRVGDVITAIEGRTVVEREDISSYVNELYVGDTVTLTVYRDGRSLQVELTLTAQTTDS